MQGRIERALIRSRLLQDNPLGDPYERELMIYLPPQYDGTRRFASVMMLPGFGSTNHSLLAFEVFKPNVVERFDRLVSAGMCAPAILVLPDAINRWGGSQYLDSPATGRYQSYLADEVIAFVDAHYRTIPTRDARAVVGKSSGGFGALRLGLDRGEMFCAIGSHAGDCAFDVSMLPELRAAAIRLSRAPSLHDYASTFPPPTGLASGDFDTIMMIACAAAYCPDMSEPLPFTRLPIDIRTGQLLSDEWSRWLAHDPVVRIAKDPEALRHMRMVFIDAGDRDEHGLQLGARRIADLLRASAVTHRYEEFAGGHRNTGHRYETSLPALVSVLATD